LTKQSRARQFVAGALSSSREKALASGRAWGLCEDRNYGTWHEMIEGDLALPEEERVDFVSVVTPREMDARFVASPGEVA
jgi:hypothetical protein